MFFKHFNLMKECFNRTTNKLPDICILSDDTERQLFSTSTNDEWRIRFLHRLWLTTCIFKLIVFPIKICDGFCPQPPDYLTCFTQSPDTLSGCVKRNSIHIALKLIPTCTY